MGRLVTPTIRGYAAVAVAVVVVVVVGVSFSHLNRMYNVKRQSTVGANEWMDGATFHCKPNRRIKSSTIRRFMAP